MRPADPRKITAISILILLLAQAFMAVLASNSFEKIHVASELSRYAVGQKDFKRKVEAALRFGKPLDNLLGMDKLIQEYVANIPDVANISVHAPDQAVLHALHPLGADLSALLGRGQQISVPDPLLEAVEIGEAYVIILPLFGPGETWMGTSTGDVLAGSVAFFFAKHQIRAGVHAFWQKSLLLGAFIGACASLLLFFVLFRVNEVNIRTLRKRIFFRALGVTILAQLAFAGINTALFHKDHILLLQERVQAQLEFLRTDLERVLSRGLDLERVGRMGQTLGELLEANPEISSLVVRDASGKTLARADKQQERALAASPGTTPETSGGTDENPAGEAPRDPPSNGGFTVTESLSAAKTGETAGTISAVLDEGTLRALTWKILLDALTIALIASLFIIEQIYFLISFVGGKKEPDATRGDQDALDTLMLARFGAFTFLFAFALPVSFVPLQMRELYVPLWNLPQNVVLGLPVSVEMLCALLSALAAGALADRHGWRRPFAAGVLITAFGLFACFQAATGNQFILARGLCGLGYGLSWMALQTFLFAHSTPTTRARGVSHFVAGLFSGHICGTALGAMLAERMGYAPVFLVGMLLALGFLAFLFRFMRSVPDRPAQHAPAALVRPRAVAGYLFDRNTFALIFCCVVPFSVCQVGLLFFATPLYLNQLGVEQADIGRVLMIYGLSVVYLAPQISKFVDRLERKKPFIVAGGLLGGLGLSLLFFDQGFAAVVGAVFLLGLASSIGSSAQTAYALKLRATQELGAGKAMAIQRAADKLGQMLGPLALGLLMSGVSIAQGIVVLGLGYMLLSVLFLFLARERTTLGRGHGRVR